MFRKLTFSLMSVLVVGVVFASSASAMSYVCVGASDSRCVGNYNMNKAGLAIAAEVANTQIAHLGPTTILIGPGTLNLDYDYGDGNIAVGAQLDLTNGSAGLEELHVVGAGRDQTTISPSNVPCCGSYKMLKFDAGPWTSSSISDLTIRGSAAITSETSLELSGGIVDDVRFDVFGGTETRHLGLATTGSDAATVKNSQFVVGGIDALAVAASSPLDISDSTIAATSFLIHDQYGIDATDNLNARRLKVTGMSQGIRASGDDTRIDDTVVRITRWPGSPGFPNYGIQLLSTPDDAYYSNARLRGVTVYGDGQDQIGISVQNSPSGPPRTSEVRFGLEDSIVSLTGDNATEVECAGLGNAIVKSTVFYSTLSMVPYLADPTPDCVKTNIQARDRLLAPPQFVDPVGDDFRPLPTSPVIDGGSDDSDRTPPKLDLALNPRFVDGNGDGSAIIDMGAFEFQPVSTTPGGSGGGAGGGGTVTPDEFKITFSNPTAKFKLRKKIFPFRAGTVKSKPRILVTSNRASRVTLNLLRPKAGWTSGKKCVAKKPKKGKSKRCDLPIKGKQAMNLPLGTSYLAFGTKWSSKALKPGKYILTAKASGLKDAPRSLLNVIR
jgi:hypothetical protein